MRHLAQAGHGLGPTEGFLDALADALRDCVTGMPGGAAVDRRAPPALVLRDMRGERALAQLPHEVGGVVGLVGTQRDRLGRSARGSIRASAASRSAWPEAHVVTASTMRPLRFSISG